MSNELLDGEINQSLPISGVVWEDDDGQRYKRVWEEGVGPKDIPITAGGGL